MTRSEDEIYNHPRYHDYLNCGCHLELLPPKEEPIFSKSGVFIKNRIIRLGYCTIHDIHTCKCGWENFYHWGTYNRTLAPLPESDESST